MEQFYEAQDFLMNTTISQKIHGNLSGEIYDRAIIELQRLEDLLSFYRETSEVSLLNRRAGKPAVKISEELLFILQQAKKYAQLSENAFCVSLAPLVQLWRRSGAAQELPSPDDISHSLTLCENDNLELNEEDHTARLRTGGAMIDLGGIGKGFSADRCCDIYKDMGAVSAFINLGGNVKTIGTRPDGKPWVIGIQHPDKPRGACYGTILCSDRSAVTSGGYERYQEVNGTKYQHIIDGRTGCPADSGLKSVTVLSESSTQADALSTAAFVLGLQKGLELVCDADCIGAVFFTCAQEVYLTKGVTPYFRLLEKLNCYEVSQ